ncbi:hypothetical protein CARUB_v10019176mg [Capsella rubella]|uniref:BTB domain-containing protein n=1 Tax=Capsella rubella TaxID=81985 RepID=R0HPB3_9BRAS|nr:putative BTB/POZ domain-containing protein At2g40440 [Capsella rubella]EOA25808.1 hypothetical protein CARUB_v10019176mg [Capsella rubella]
MAKQTNQELFVGGLARALKEQRHVDVCLKAGESDEKGVSISAHKIVLSARSEVFKKILESDEIKATTKLETITLSELKHEELDALVEFIYSDGTMLSEQGKQHVMSLFLAADKYEIPHLRDLCRSHLRTSMNVSNALTVLALAQIPIDQALSDDALGYIRANMSAICSTAEFEDFVVNYPSLTVEILKGIYDPASGRGARYTCN